MGRFITEDPIKDGNNWYIYCNNNPLTYIDPTGLRYGDPSVARNESGVAVSVSGENHGFNSLNERSGPWNGYNGAGSQGIGDCATDLETINKLDIMFLTPEEMLEDMFDQMIIDMFNETIRDRLTGTKQRSWKRGFTLDRYETGGSYFVGFSQKLREYNGHLVYEYTPYEIDSFRDDDSGDMIAQEFDSAFEPKSAVVTIEVFTQDKNEKIKTDVIIIENQSAKDKNQTIHGVSASIPIGDNFVGAIANITVNDGSRNKEGKEVGYYK